jgi:hypothetical protein
MSEANVASLLMSGLALLVSLSMGLSTFVFNKKKAARDLWQRQLELYIANPSHLLGRAKDKSEEAEQAYRAHVGYIFLAIEELLSAFPGDASWQNLVRRHIQRHAVYTREVLGDPDRRSTYSDGLQRKMKEALNAHS